MSRWNTRCPRFAALVAGSTLVVATLLATPPAQAAWLGLDDGDYAIALHCDSSPVIPCPSTITGMLSVSGGAADALDLTIDGRSFQGDPFDGLDGNATVDFEYSGLSTASPSFSFVNLMFVTDGSFGIYGTGDRFWLYCANVGPGVCTPNTIGHWDARAIGTVAEPSAAALLAIGLLACARRSAVRRRGDRAAARA